MSRETRTIVVKEWDEDFVVPLAEFISELQAVLAEVPEEFRAVAQIEFDRTGDDYDYSRGEMSVHFNRPETDQEMSGRQASREASERAELERARRQYEALKARFET